VASSFTAGRTLMIVADETLQGLSFGALRQPNGRYLIEDYSLIVSPNVSLTQASAEPPETPRRALIVQPATNGSPAGTLREAAQEAAEEAAIYEQSTLLPGSSATRSRLRQTAGRFDVLHFAGHAESNPRYPQLSRILLTPEANGDTGMFAYE